MRSVRRLGPVLGLAAFIAVSGAADFIPATVAFRLPDKELIPEGIALDARTGRFFLSSIAKEKVVVVEPSGKARDFIPSGRDGVMESLGLKVDEVRRRLWVLSNKDIGERHVSAVHVFQADSGALLQKHVLDGRERRLLNDLALLPDGSAYLTDTEGHRLYFVPADLSRVELFLESKDLLTSANGIAASPDGRLLYVAALKHITVVEAASKAMRPAANPSAVPDSGIDGLLYHRGGLAAVVNGVAAEQEIHIARFDLSPDGWEIRGKTVIDRGNPMFHIPTTAALDGDDLYCLAATCLDVFLRSGLNDSGHLHEPVVLRYRLAGR
ncbi:MAG: SMP-30/gluconolactonase/LRE family protein [Candidatus Aminicenantes bacterium]|nr:SMP-30/gluconolactonase/LRE family protein [Candidatus Aminicenantes bacterium]